MLRSPHKKRKLYKLRGLLSEVGPVPMFAKNNSSNRGGNSGNKYKKRHTSAQQPPGRPRGVCLGVREVRTKRGTLIDICECGKHGNR